MVMKDIGRKRRVIRREVSLSQPRGERRKVLARLHGARSTSCHAGEVLRLSMTVPEAAQPVQQQNTCAAGERCETSESHQQQDLYQPARSLSLTCLAVLEDIG
jgi:hypothetical protein